MMFFTSTSGPLSRGAELYNQYGTLPHHKVRTSLSYVILEFCRIASSTRFLFRSASHNVQLCLLDNKPNNSSRRGCHGYGNRSDAPHLSLVTERGSVGTKVEECLVFAGRFYQLHSRVTMIYLLKEVTVYKTTFLSHLNTVCVSSSVPVLDFLFPLFAFIHYLSPHPTRSIPMIFRLTK